MKRMSLLLALLAAALAACGSSGPSTKIDVVMTDFTFVPDSFTVPAGQEITINAANNGAVEHEFVVMKFGTEVGEDFGDEDAGNIYWEVEILPGESESATFTAPTEPGEYQVVCGTPGHYFAGMAAKLIVAAP